MISANLGHIDQRYQSAFIVAADSPLQDQDFHWVASRINQIVAHRPCVSLRNVRE
jgi:hypothetical protein